MCFLCICSDLPKTCSITTPDEVFKPEVFVREGISQRPAYRSKPGVFLQQTPLRWEKQQSLFPRRETALAHDYQLTEHHRVVPI